MTAAEVMEAVDMVEYIGQYTDLTQKGEEWWGISPFNTEEKTPSFSVSPSIHAFCDFSANKSGNLIEFVKEYHGLTVGQAVRHLKQYAGIQDEEGSENQSLRLLSSGIAKKFRRKPDSKQTPAPPLDERYMKRYVWDEGKLKLWADEGISLDVMRSFGVMYDQLDNRIVYPIRDTDGNLRCVSGRTCDPDYKAKGLRKYTYTTSIGSMPVVYGLYEHMEQIVAAKRVILFEGCKSVMKLATWGNNLGAALLTSHLSKTQFRTLMQLASYHSVTIVFALDSDIDITKDHEIMQLCRYAKVEWVKNRDGLLLPKEAPVDRGIEVWNTLYERRTRLR